MNGRKAMLAAAIVSAVALMLAPTWTEANIEAGVQEEARVGRAQRDRVAGRRHGHGAARADPAGHPSATGREDLVMNQLDHTGLVHTDPADPAQTVTDSAAAATAFSTGTSHSTVRSGSTGPPRGARVLEDARRPGKATGLVTTSQVTDASPAAFGAHVSTAPSRARSRVSTSWAPSPT